MTRRIVLWRHGQTPWNAQRRAQGQSDIALDEVGHAQAKQAASRLVHFAPVRLMSSDLSRAFDTAGYLSKLTGLSVESDKRLREMGFGKREGMTVDEAWAAFPEAMRAWSAGDETQVPDSETHADAGERFASALRDYAETLDEGQTMVVTAHGTIIRTGVCAFLGIAAEHWRLLAGMENCHWSVLEESPYHRKTEWRLKQWNVGEFPESQ